MLSGQWLARGSGREELPHAPTPEARGRGLEEQPTTPHPRPGEVAGRTNPMSKIGILDQIQKLNIKTLFLYLSISLNP